MRNAALRRSAAYLFEGLRAAGLTDVEVTDRLVYERDQIARLLAAKLMGGVVS